MFCQTGPVPYKFTQPLARVELTRLRQQTLRTAHLVGLNLPLAEGRGVAVCPKHNTNISINGRGLLAGGIRPPFTSHLRKSQLGSRYVFQLVPSHWRRRWAMWP